MPIVSPFDRPTHVRNPSPPSHSTRTSRPNPSSPLCDLSGNGNSGVRRPAGRTGPRRPSGKVHFLNVLDWSGKPVTRCTEGVEGKHEAVEYQALSSRVQVMVGAKEVGETGWQLAQQLDLGDLIGVDGTF